MRLARLAAHPGLAVGVLAGVLNSNYLLERVLPQRLPPATSVVSDLAVAGQPWAWAYRAGDVGSALLLLALAAHAWRLGRPERRPAAWRAGVALLAGFATSTLLAVLVPEQCVTGGGPCPPGADVGGLQDAAHDAISSVGSLAGICAALAFARAGRGRGEVAAHLAAAVGAGGLGLAFVVVQQAGSAGWVGWTQRGQILVLSAWFAVVGWSVDRRRAEWGGPAMMRS